jgi:multicomponent Na+:H+ antiporter subunit G
MSETIEVVLDLIGGVLILAGSFFCLTASLAQVRFPDVLARMHAATKPQVLGLLLVLGGVMFIMPSWPLFGFLTLVVVFQIMTAPISSHMVARAAYRSTQWDHEDAIIDELRDEVLDSGVSQENLRAALLDATIVRPPEDGSAKPAG